MWSIFQPDERRLRTILDVQSKLGCSYPEQGMTNFPQPPAGYDTDHNRVRIGEGEAVFRAACEVLRRWQQFPAGWTRIWPADTPLEPGQTVTVSAHTLGLWWANAARILFVVDETTPHRRFGFA